MLKQLDLTFNLSVSINEFHLKDRKLVIVHLVYCDDKEKVLEKILDGTKTMIIRAATGRKIPHSRVFAGETLYFMKKGT